MKRKEKNSKKVLAFLLSFLMTASIGTAFAACGDTTEETETDSEDTNVDEDVVSDNEELISNATFALNPYEELKPIVTNTTGWTRSTNSVASGVASTSDAASGIIDVNSEKWLDLTTSNLTGVTAADLTEEEAAEKWDTLSTRDKLEYYEAWNENTDNDDRSISDLEFYEAFNIDVDDLPLKEDENENLIDIGNPGLYSQDATDTRVLMIHNQKQTDNYLGTAQKYTSTSTVTVKTGEVATFSVWVKTVDLMGAAAGTTDGKANLNYKEDSTAYNKGAYIQITHTVGGKACDPLEIKNINTAGVTDNNGWVKYEFQLYSSSFADATFSIVLGLGQSGGTDKEEYVNGYAFFDDITCEVSDIPETVNLDGYETIDFAADKTAKTIYANKMDKKQFALDFYGTSVGGFSDWTDWATDTDEPLTVAPTTETRAANGLVFSTVVNDGDGTRLPEGLNKSLGSDYDITGTYTLKNLANVSGDAEQDSLYNSTWNKYFADDDFLGNSDTDALLILSKNGAAYSAKKELVIKANECRAISFYVKTSSMGSYTGAGIRLEFADDEVGATQQISAIDTTTVVDEDSNTDGWQKVYFFINNTTDKDQSATLTLSFGLTSGIIDATANSFAPGFAAFAGFEQKILSETEFEYANSGTYSKVVDLEEEEEETQVDGGFDSVGALDSDTIKTTYANPKNYKGVYNDSAFTGGGKELTTNQLATAGLLNQQYAADYTTILETLGGSATATWDDVFGYRTTQPLVIYNEEAWTNKTYGFIGNSATISANTYKTVSLRVKVSAGATANIYLIDTSTDNYNSTLSIGSKLAYWYDADGNVCIEDPTGEDFNAKTDVAFRLQSNGLYQVNTNWTGSAGLDTSAYYANLSAYLDNYDADTTHLYLDDLATDYEYSENWKHDGNDRIAFYYYDAASKSAYAYSDKTTKVYDFSVATELTPRQTANEAKDLHVTVSDTNGEWKIVTFYIHTGESAKSYRLEVWNGAREGGDVAANSYVMFDSWSPSSELTSTTWETMVEERKEATGATVESFDGVFSFYDSAKYFRYDETLDELSVGNAYESYDPTTESETVAYLYSDDAEMCTVFADYATSETAVTKDAADTATDEEEEEEEEDDPTNVWLLVSSISIAAVLLVAIASLVIRKVISVRRKKMGYEPPKKERKSKKNK